jgi:hypothetical protein
VYRGNVHVIPVSLVRVACEGKQDWAVFRLTNVSDSFEPGDVANICSSKNIPHSFDEPYFKLYHCPAGDFNSETITLLEATTSGWMKAKLTCY